MNSSSEFSVSDMSNRAMAIFFGILMLPIAELFIISALRAGPFVLLGSIVLTYAAAIYLHRKTQRKMLVTVYGDRITFVHIQKPLFENAVDRDCSVADIESYSFNDVGGPKLVLYFNDGTKFRVMAGTSSKKRVHVERLAEMIIPLIEQGNSQKGSIAITKRRKSFYEGPGGLVLAIACIVIVAATVWGIIFLPDRHSTKDVISAMGYDLMCLALAIRIFSLRAANKAKQKAEEEILKGDTENRG